MIRFENKSNGRFYYLLVEKDESNNFALRIIRGGRNIRIVRSVLFDCALSLRNELDRLSKRRLRRGYSLVI